MKKIVILMLIITIVPGILLSKQFPKVGTAAYQFLKLGVDARAIGMGEAYTPVTDDISSVYWNPAGLAVNLESSQIFLSHTLWVADIYHDYLALSKPTSLGVFAFSTQALYMPYMDVYEEDTFEHPTGETFTCYDFAAALSYANSFTDKFNFGFTLRYIREGLDEVSSNDFSFDLGTTYNTGWKNLIIGMSLRNFGPDMGYKVDDDKDGKFDEDPFDLLDNDGDGLIDEDRKEMKYKIPMNFSMGLSLDLLNKENSRWIAAFQIDNTVDRLETYNLGTEYRIGVFALRTGYQFNYDAAGLSFGFGVKIPMRFGKVSFDYAYSSFGDLQESAFSTPMRISLKIEY